MKTYNLLGWWWFLGWTGLGTALGGQTLPGHIPSVVAHLSPKGNLPATNRLALAIGLPLRRSTELDDFLTRVYDPTSPDYRHYLTPPEFTEQFGPTEADYEAVTAFARQNHLTISATHANRLLLDVNGSVGDVQRAFNITLKVYRHPTEARDFYAPDTEPSVADGLRVADISGLNNYAPPRPKGVKTKDSTAAAVTSKTGSGSSGTYAGDDFRDAYLPGVTLTGAGQSLGLLEFDGFYASDISKYETAFGLPSVPLQTVLLDGYNGTPTTGTDSGNGEVSLDIEMAVCMAPGLTKLVVFEAGPSGTPNDILNAMAADTAISQFSCSWGWSGGPSTTTDSLFKEMAAQGQSFFNAAGDSDAFTTGAGSANGVDNTSLGDTPASCPYITQVGGTTLTTTGPGGAWSSETAWNWGLHDGSYVGGSGGISSYYSIPSWQAGVGMTSNGGSTTDRNIPDVALTADNIYVDYGDGSSGTFGGTSCATPLWAGLAALMNEQALLSGRSPVGFINPAVYALGEGSHYTADFHDITTGNNAWPASASAFYAVTGYDLCTGWGTPAGQSLINALAGMPDPLEILSGTGFSASGEVGGPFTVTSSSLTLSNLGTNALAWTAGNVAAWLSVTPFSGTLVKNGERVVTASLNATASTLPAGNYTNTLSFTNLTSGNALSFTFTLTAGQNLVLNGGFETGDFTDWTLVGTANTRQTTYNTVDPSSRLSDGTHSGSYAAFLGDDVLATLSQTLSTEPGRSYLLSFWLNNPVSGSSQLFMVDWNTNSAATRQIYYLTDPPAFAWTNLSFILTATGTNTVLQFDAENPPDYFGLDDISATPIPTPSITAVTHTAHGLSLTWYAVSNLIYQVLYATNLTQAVWTPLSTNTATGTLLTVTNLIEPDHQRFYRIRRYP